MFEVTLAPEAQEFFASADPPLARKLARCFAQLEHDPRRHNNIKRLSHTNPNTGPNRSYLCRLWQSGDQEYDQ